MEYYRFGEVLVPGLDGGLCDDAASAIEFVQSVESDVLIEQLQNLGFTTDEEGILTVLINNKRFFITLTALKDLCKLLKVPASYINKFPGRDLVLENLNNNPYLKENSEMLKLVIWDSEEHPVIAGVLPSSDSAMSYGEVLSLMQDAGAFDREATVLEQIAVTDEELVSYFLLKESMKHEGFDFQMGFSIHYSATRAVDTLVMPFCRMNVISKTGEPFDFDFEGGKKLRIIKRKSEEFLGQTIDIVQAYEGADLGAYYDEVLKYATVSSNVDEIKYALLKYMKSRAASSYNYAAFKVDGNQVTEEVIPEYNEFYKANKEQLKEMETYAANNMPVNFYLPVFFNRLYTFESNMENPHYMIRYRKSIGNMLNKVLDDRGDVIV